MPTSDKLDRYTQQSIFEFDGKGKGYVAFAGQRDDGFYADINSIFDLLSLRNQRNQPPESGKDSQGGFNLHLMALSIPIEELGPKGDQQIVGVYATTSRQKVSVLRGNQGSKGKDEKTGKDNISTGPWVQVARQGNPLFNEGLVAIVDKDLYSRTSPTVDSKLFRKYAENPELATLINALLDPPLDPPAVVTTGRTDISAIYIPDLIKVDLSTPGVRFAGSGPGHPTNPDDPGFSRLGIFGTPPDVLQSNIQDPFGNDGLIPGGWPNGRRFGDDVVDIAITAIISDLRTLPLIYSRGGRNRRRERQRHRFQQDVPVRRHSAERPQPRTSGSKSESDSLTACTAAGAGRIANSNCERSRV